MLAILAAIQLIGRLIIAGVFWGNFLVGLWLIMLGSLTPSAFNFAVLAFFLLLALVATYSSSPPGGLK